ncbi:MAG: hypothetical protein ABSH20_01710 [Tepidisphaeraceae bacterium]|jgi:hypothetical protein
MESETWSQTEKKAAHAAFEQAYARECKAIAGNVRARAERLDDPAELWKLTGYLLGRRREIDEKYDYRYSVLITVFARLVHEGWLTLDDLKGLREDKIRRIQEYLGIAST